MRMTLRLLRLAVISVLLPIAISAQSEWKGEYSFFENGGRTAGGTAILVTHELRIFEGGDGLAATLESNGYQTSVELICSARIEGGKIMIVFENYGENNIFEPYRQGDVLLTLERKTAKGKPVVLTHWGKFTPSIETNNKPGKVYFVRSITDVRKN